MSDQQQVPVFVIPTNRKTADLAADTLISQAAIADRSRSVSTLLPTMSETLNRFYANVNLSATHSRLLTFAQFLVDAGGRSKLDRLAKRHKPALLCWFCEECQELLQSPELFVRYMTERGEEMEVPRRLPGVAEIMRMAPPPNVEVPQATIYRIRANQVHGSMSASQTP